MYPLSSLTRAQEDYFTELLRGSEITVRYRARLFNNDDEPLSDELILGDGEVVVDSSQMKKEPTRTAHVTIYDPHHQMVIDPRSVVSSSRWFTRQLQLHYDVWMPRYDQWCRIPIFRGWIFEVSRHGIEVEIDAVGKESQHLEPFVFPRSFSLRKHIRYHNAIRQLFAHRGETRFRLDEVQKRLPKGRTWGLGQEPWRVGQNLADHVDRMLFYRGDGFLTMRKRNDNPVWVFRNDGPNATIVEDPEERISLDGVTNLWVVRGEKTVKQQMTTTTALAERVLADANTIKVRDSTDMKDGRQIIIGGEVRTISGSYTSGSKTVPLVRKLDKNHPAGAPVKVKFKGEKQIPVVGRAALEGTNPLSAFTLTNGDRPMVKIVDLPRIHKYKTAVERARKLRDRSKHGIEDEVSIVCRPIPHLEERDVVQVVVGDVWKKITVKNFTIPLHPEGTQQINWVGRKRPRRRNRGKGGKRGGRRSGGKRS